MRSGPLSAETGGLTQYWSAQRSKHRRIVGVESRPSQHFVNHPSSVSRRRVRLPARGIPPRSLAKLNLVSRGGPRPLNFQGLTHATHLARFSASDCRRNTCWMRGAIRPDYLTSVSHPPRASTGIRRSRIPAPPRHATIGLPLRTVISDVARESQKLLRRPKGRIGKVERNRNVVQNAWVVGDTRIPTAAIRCFHEAGYSTADLLKEYPTLTENHLLAALAHEEKQAAAA